MNVWLMHVSEELPMDGSSRTFRYGYLANALQQNGHSVVRWAPTFRHRTKSHRFEADTRVSISPNYDIQFVHSPGYQRHIGLARLRTYRILGQRFHQLAEQLPAPDVIVSAIPSLEWAAAALRQGRKSGARVVIDVRDIWPDIYLNAFPNFARPLGRRILARQFRSAADICRRADGLTGVAPSYLQWALDLAGRRQRATDAAFPLGFEVESMTDPQVEERLQPLRDMGIDFDQPICLFAGRFERSYDLTTVVNAAKHFGDTSATPAQFVLCGGGSGEAAIRRLASGVANVHLPGWVDGATLQAVSSRARIGLCAYARDATQSIPNKPFEYMAHKLAVVSSLQGDLAEMLTRHDCGVTYEAGSAASLVSCLQNLLANKQRLLVTGENGQAAWQRHYRSHEIYQSFVDHLASLSDQAAVPAAA